MPSKLQPIHSSVLKTRLVYAGSPRPVKMQKVALSEEQRQFVEELSLSIFTDMVNAGCTLQETLAAIYMSGLHHGGNRDST